MSHPLNDAGNRPNSRTARVHVVGAPHAWAIAAKTRIGEGATLFHVDGKATDRPSRYSIQIGEHAHIDLEPGLTDEHVRTAYPWRFLNHSCEPNAVLRGRDFVALRAIAAGEPVTYDYNTTEYDMAAPFDCHCGRPRCLGRISGFKHLSPAEQARLAPWLADHLRRRLDASARFALK
jgi:SET domain